MKGMCISGNVFLSITEGECMQETRETLKHSLEDAAWQKELFQEFGL